MGNAGQLPALLPGFVFLVALPVVDQDRALELSKRPRRWSRGRSGEELTGIGMRVVPRQKAGLKTLAKAPSISLTGQTITRTVSGTCRATD